MGRSASFCSMAEKGRFFWVGSGGAADIAVAPLVVAGLGVYSGRFPPSSASVGCSLYFVLLLFVSLVIFLFSFRRADVQFL